MKRVTLKGLNRIAEDHNKHNSGDNWSWEDVIYNECLCGHNVKEDFDKMSKKETLIVMDWAAFYKDGESCTWEERKIYQKIYDAAKDSLMERL